MAQIEILSEEVRASGWAFRARVLDETGAMHPVRLTLAWADYNLWSPGGGDRPAAVAEAVLRFLAGRRPAHRLARSFDASIARRLFPDADREIPALIA